MQNHLWEKIKDSAWKQEIVLASVPLWKYKDGIPIAVASACLIDFMNCRFLLSIAHASIATSIWCMEIKGVVKDENGALGTVLQPIDMGFLTEINLENESNPKIVDFTYRKLPPDTTSYQVLSIIRNDKVFGAERSVLKAKYDIILCKTTKYGFYGKVRFGGVKDRQIIFEDRLEDDLTYMGTEGDYFVFKLSHKYGSHDNYRGCSGAPIIDENKNLIGLVSYGIKSKNLIYALNISNYLSALEIETKPI